jgi:hypothetical protein
MMKMQQKKTAMMEIHQIIIHLQILAMELRTNGNLQDHPDLVEWSDTKTKHVIELMYTFEQYIFKTPFT